MQADDRCLEYERQLFQVKHYGATRFRKVHVHSSKIFSVEQMVSFSVAQQENEPWCGECARVSHSPLRRVHGGWSALIGLFLLDRGKDFMGRYNYPWASPATAPQAGRRASEIIPTIPYNSLVSEPIDDVPENVAQNLNSLSLHSYHPADDLLVEEDNDYELLRQDPFYLLSRLYRHAARSWSQLLNFLDGDIEACPAVSASQFSTALEQLRFNVGLLTRI